MTTLHDTHDLPITDNMRVRGLAVNTARSATYWAGRGRPLRRREVLRALSARAGTLERAVHKHPLFRATMTWLVL